MLIVVTASAVSAQETALPAEAAASTVATSPSAAATDVRTAAADLKSRSAALRRPNGPVTVTADRAEWQQAGAMRYAGHVMLAVDTLVMHGQNLELKQFEDGQYEAHLTGEPARLTDAGGEGAPPIAAEARKLDYDARTGMVDLTGGALLSRGSDRLTGENIRYDVNARRVQAAGGDSGQVRIVIQPPPDKNKP
jgi:lipopolysaccharide export system protein LptA